MCTAKCKKCNDYNINQQNQQSSLCNLLIKYNFNFVLKPFNEVSSFKLKGMGCTQVWKDAAMQIIFAMSNCMGGLLSLASYNRFHHEFIRYGST